MKTLHIVTGPPGGGKSTWAKHNFPDVPIFDTDLGNKSFWRDEQGDAILMTSAPGTQAKAFWAVTAMQFGFTPQVWVINPGKAIAVQRLLSRDMKVASSRTRLSKTVQRWYKNYSKYPGERLVEWRERCTSSPDQLNSPARATSASHLSPESSRTQRQQA